MPEYVYRGEPGLTYPAFSACGAANPEPGETYNLPHAPRDDRWEKPAPKTTKKTDPAPAGDTKE